MLFATIPLLFKESLSRTCIREVDDIEVRNIRRGGLNREAGNVRDDGN